MDSYGSFFLVVRIWLIRFKYTEQVTKKITGKGKI